MDFFIWQCGLQTLEKNSNISEAIMKASFKKHVASLTSLKSKIAKEEETAAGHQSALSASKTRLKHLRGDMAELESAAASDGLSVAELHEAVDSK